LEKLLDPKKGGGEIYKDLKDRAAADDSPGFSRTVWSNDDFRIDVGHVDRVKGILHWEFQVNRKASSEAKELLRLVDRGRRSKTSTHIKLFESSLDIKNPPEFKKWRDAVLECLKKI